MQNPEDLVATLRNSFKNGTTKPTEYRLKQLNNLLQFLEDNTQNLIDALKDDLHKHPIESLLSEINYCKNDARGAIYNLKEWSKPRPVEKSLPNIMDEAEIHPEPYGVALILGAWNYPVCVTLSPMIGAIAAGNTVLLKPSELSPATSKVFAEMLPKYLDTNCYKVFTGGPKETENLLNLRFDYIFFTGSTRVGKLVSMAAAKYLTPITLELGGKSPCYIDDTVDIELAASRILWGKTINSGQTCIAPDYVLCNKSVEKKFLEVIPKVLKEKFGENIQYSNDFCRIINSNHFNRIINLLKDQEIAIGGKNDPSEKYIEPTICINVDPKSPLMSEEIFGPILPIIQVNNAADAIHFINGREKPLALYVFSNDKQISDLFINETSSGATIVNDTIMHFVCDSLPFGGVGESGMGAYHGKYSFDTFSHLKPVLKKKIDRIGEMMMSFRYPPYTENKKNILEFLVKKRPTPAFN